jgi:hypothetical protein
VPRIHRADQALKSVVRVIPHHEEDREWTALTKAGNHSKIPIMTLEAKSTETPRASP